MTLPRIDPRLMRATAAYEALQFCRRLYPWRVRPTPDIPYLEVRRKPPQPVPLLREVTREQEPRWTNEWRREAEPTGRFGRG
jgi:hypothetical protein